MYIHYGNTRIIMDKDMIKPLKLVRINLAFFTY